jgi:hypothetical protein
MNPINTLQLVGKQFGKLKVIELDHKKRRSYWLCKCDCGNVKTIRGTSLTSGATKSCGCLSRRTGENHPRFNGYKEISGRKWIEIRKSCQKRNLDFDITLPYLWELFLKQNRLCALTKLPLTFSYRWNDRDGTASLDRIDSSKGYIKGNVQWVHKDINLMKWNLDQSHFIKMCKLVSETAMVRE